MRITAHDPALSRRVRDVGVMRMRSNREATSQSAAYHTGRVRTYARGRRCACGTLLSRYNPSGQCATCEATA